MVYFKVEFTSKQWKLVSIYFVLGITKRTTCDRTTVRRTKDSSALSVFPDHSCRFNRGFK